MGKNNIVIAGSGLSALILACMVKKYKDTDAKILVVERDDKIGGQFGSFNYGEHGYFDYGMHIYYESCIPEIDTLFTSILHEKDWNILEDNVKDIAGLFVNGKLQTNTPYIDLRNLPKEQWKKYVAGIFQAIRQNTTEVPEGAGAYEILRHHFGHEVADEIFVPVLEKLYLTEANQLDEIATQLTTINRVALFDEKTMLDLMQSFAIRSRICYPDQFSLPKYRTNNQRAFYPKKFGMIHVLEKLKAMLEEQGVEFLTSTIIKSLGIKENRIDAINIVVKDQERIIEKIEKVYWTAGLPPLAATLKVNMSDLTNDKKKTETYYVNFLFDKNPTMDRLYYFYCFDKGYRSFRVTNYTNYCPGAAENRGYPLCVEFWAEETDSKNEQDIIALSQKELYSFGVIDDTYKVVFSKAEKVIGGGFPLPSVKNIANVKTIRQRIKQQQIENLVTTGVLAEDNVFFIKDVLIDTYKKVMENN